MGWSGEQLVERAQAAARTLLDRLEGQKLVLRFVDSYVMGFDRPAIKVPADVYQQRMASLRGEAVMWLGVSLLEQLQRPLARFNLGPLVWRNPAAEARFAENLWTALAGQLGAGREVAASLRQEWEVYEALPDAAARAERFAARIAPLLDPVETMREKAHYAGIKFTPVLTAEARKLADELLR